jgi:hypothetical protein
MYSNVYLFDPTLPSLAVQKNKERIKEIIRQTILNTIRDNIPVEQLLKAYLDETTELMDEPKKKKEDKDKEREKEKGIRFSETNMAMSVDNEESVYVTPEEEPAMKIMDVCLDPLPVEDLTPKQVPVEPELPVELPIEILEVKEEPVKKEPEIVLDIVELI